MESTSIKNGLTLTSYGAAGEVTGSKHLLETPTGSRILLDCGLFQGKREVAAHKNCDFGFNPGSIDAVIISHAHIDHTGLLPKLAKDGFKGPIYATQGTVELCEPMLMDSARIQREDEAFIARHHVESPVKNCLPLYNEEDVPPVLQQFVGKPYYESFSVTDDVTAEFYDAGHVFGSAIIVLDIQVPGGSEKLVFTGDLGRADMPIIRDPELIEKTHHLVIESTYGDRRHEGVDELEEDLSNIIKKTAKRGGKIFIPSFALERTQEIILRLEELIHTKKIPHLKIYIDSPLASKITSIFEKHPEYYDEEMKRRYEENPKIFSFSNLRFTDSVEESKELNSLHGPCIIIAGSGMAESGRIRHHLKNNIEDPRHTILFVGYQAEETLGRKLTEGNKVVRIFNQDYRVRAEVVMLKALSAHADRDNLDDYIQNIKGLKSIFVVHGEESSRRALADRVAVYAPKLNVVLPEFGKTYVLE